MPFRFRSTIETINTEAKRLAKNIKCGHHSGFKPCCIAWYSTVWQTIIKHPRIRKTYIRFIRSSFPKDGHPGYIPCPKCTLKRDFVKVEDCSCGERLRETFGKDDKAWEKMDWYFVLNELDW